MGRAPICVAFLILLGGCLAPSETGSPSTSASATGSMTTQPRGDGDGHGAWAVNHGNAGLTGASGVPRSTDLQLRRNLTLGEQVSDPSVVGADAYVTLDGSVVKLALDGVGSRWSFDAALFSTPIVKAGLAIVASRTEVYALDNATGTKLWSHVVAPAPIYGAPAMDTRRIYVPSDGILALDSQTGQELWNVSLPGELRPPTLLGGSLYVTGKGDEAWLASVDAGSGLQKWKTALPNAGGAISQPAVLGHAAYVTTSDALVAFDTASGAVLWTQRNLDHPTLPVAANGRVLNFDWSGLHAFEATQGTLLWTYVTGEAGCRHNSDGNGGVCLKPSQVPSTAGNVIVLPGYDAKLHVVNATSGKAIRTMDLGVSFDGQTAALSDRYAVVKSSRGMLVFEFATAPN